MISFIIKILAYALCAPLLAQTGTTHSTQGVPIHHGTYTMHGGFEMQTGSYARSGPETLFENLGGYFYTVPPVGSEFVSDGAFPQRGVLADEQVNGFDFDYCSTDPGSIDAEIRFYTDTNCTTGPSGAAACTYALAGLPGDTSGFGISCWNVSVDLSGGFECTLPQETTAGGQEPFGWSEVFTNAAGTALSGPILASGFDYGSTNCMYDIPSGTSLAGSHTMTIFGSVMDTRSLSDTVNLRPGNVLELTVDLPVKPAATVTYTAEGASPGTTYALVASVAPSGSFPGIGVGNNTSLLLQPPILAPSPLTMVQSGNTATLVVALPASLPATLTTQVFGFSGAIAPANIVEGSNALIHN
ncbi:MAG: hypothetical protein ACYSU1_04775 [Planctomycetota bacterium]|jgi:hypothetical protein